MKLDVGMLTHDLASIPDYARKVEAMGYDCLWSSETQHDPYLPLAVAASTTSSFLRKNGRSPRSWRMSW